MTSTHPSPQHDTIELDETNVLLERNDRGGYSLLALGIFGLVPIGNYPTETDARRFAARSCLTIID